jgi:hypothetical protein
VGLPLAGLPLEPQLGSSLLAACVRYNCADHLLLLAGLLSVPAVWAHAGGGARRSRGAAVEKFAVAEGDLVTFLNAHRAWAENGRSQKWWVSASCTCVWWGGRGPQQMMRQPSRPLRRMATTGRKNLVRAQGLGAPAAGSGPGSRGLGRTRAEDAATQLRASSIFDPLRPAACACRAYRHFVHHYGMQRAEEVAKQLRTRLARASLLPRDAASVPFDLPSVLRAVAAGLFFNAAQYDRTEYDPRTPDDGGTHVYRLLRHTKQGERAGCGLDPRQDR